MSRPLPEMNNIAISKKDAEQGFMSSKILFLCSGAFHLDVLCRY